MPSAAVESHHAKRLRVFADTMISIGAAEIEAQLGTDTALAKLVMAAATTKLCAMFSGQTFYVPSGLAAGLSERNDAICRRYAQPASEPSGSRPFSQERVCELAAEFGLTQRSLYSIIRSARSRLRESQGQGALIASASL